MLATRLLLRNCICHHQVVLPSSSCAAKAFSTGAKLPEEVSFSQFEDLRMKKSATLYDVREPRELEQLGAIPGATNVPLGEFEAAFGLTNDNFEARFGSEMPLVEDPVVVFCAKGMRSLAAREILVGKFGFGNVANYKGSFNEWKAKQEEG